MHILEQIEKFNQEGPYKGQEIFLTNIKILKIGKANAFIVPQDEIKSNRIVEQELFDVLLIRKLEYGKKKQMKGKTFLEKKREVNNGTE